MIPLHLKKKKKGPINSNTIVSEYNRLLLRHYHPLKQTFKLKKHPADIVCITPSNSSCSVSISVSQSRTSLTYSNRIIAPYSPQWRSIVLKSSFFKGRFTKPVPGVTTNNMPVLVLHHRPESGSVTCTLFTLTSWIKWGQFCYWNLSLAWY